MTDTNTATGLLAQNNNNNIVAPVVQLYDENGSPATQHFNDEGFATAQLYDAQGNPSTTFVHDNAVANAVKDQYGGFVYKSKQQLDQEAAQAAAANQSGGKIICQQYHTLGILSDELNALDQAYGAWLMKTNKRWQQGYLRYAKHIVKRLHRDTWQGRCLIAILTPLVHVWSQEMGYRMGGNYQHSQLGSVLMWLMVRVFMTLNSMRVMSLRIKAFFRKNVAKWVFA